jgi:hypothetical protein
MPALPICKVESVPLPWTDVASFVAANKRKSVASNAESMRHCAQLSFVNQERHDFCELELKKSSWFKPNP